MEHRVSDEQVVALLDCLAEHPSMAKGIGLGPRAKKKTDKFWNDLAMKLNAYKSGSSKSGERWKRYWADLKHKSKTRPARRRQAVLGGSSNQDNLSDIEQKVLAIIGKQAVYGDLEHEVPVFTTQPTTPPPVSEETVLNDDQSKIFNDTYEEVNIEPERPEIDKWVMDIEKNRMESERKFADATLIMAESTRVLAESSRLQAESFHLLAETLQNQSKHTNAILDLLLPSAKKQYAPN